MGGLGCAGRGESVVRERSALKWFSRGEGPAVSVGTTGGLVSGFMRAYLGLEIRPARYPKRYDNAGWDHFRGLRGFSSFGYLTSFFLFFSFLMCFSWGGKRTLGVRRD